MGLLRRRLAPEAIIEGHDFGEPLAFGGATVWFHPAGRTALSRIARWRTDKPASQADRLTQAHALLPSAVQGGQA